MIEALQRKQIRRGLRSQEIQNAKDFQAKVGYLNSSKSDILVYVYGLQEK